MTKAELLIPRYLTIGDFPFNTYYPVGKIISIPTDKYAMSENGYPVVYCDFSDYPNCFKPLQWWEERKIDDLPEYVEDQTSSSMRFYKVDEWTIDNDGIPDFRVGGIWPTRVFFVEPSTLEDYQKYQNEKQ